MRNYYKQDFIAETDYAPKKRGKVSSIFRDSLEKYAESVAERIISSQEAMKDGQFH